MSGSRDKILILENEPLIAMDLEYVLDAAGLGPITWVASCAEADDWLSKNTPRLAILDIMLQDGPPVGIAEALIIRGVPVIVCSAASRADADQVFDQAVWVSKPCDAERLISTVDSILDETAPGRTPPHKPNRKTWLRGGFL